MSGYEPNAFSVGEPCKTIVSSQRCARVSRAGTNELVQPSFSLAGPSFFVMADERAFGKRISPPRDTRVRAGGDGGAAQRAPPLPRGIIQVLSPCARRSTFVAVIVLLNVAALFMANHAHGSGN